MSDDKLLEAAALDAELPSNHDQTKSVTRVQIDLDAPLSCGLSRKEIFQMKKAGIEKPGFVPWSEWNGPKKLTHRHLFICYLAAAGRKAREIAQQTNMDESRISLLLNSEAMQEQIQIIQSVEFQGLGVNQQVDQLVPEAMRVAQRLLKSDSTPDSLKWRVADKIIDRKIGKPLQRTQLEGGSLISDMWEFMQERSQEREAISVPPQKPSQEDIEDAEIIESASEEIKELQATERKEFEDSLDDESRENFKSYLEKFK